MDELTKGPLDTHAANNQIEVADPFPKVEPILGPGRKSSVYPATSRDLA
jgi:hypothetical protein